MKQINPNKNISELTVLEFIELQNSLNYNKTRNYVYGIKGLAKLLGCSRSKASNIKQSGILDEAIFQNGNIIIIDADKALQLFGNKV
ncbi:DUF3853 family protein [Empedobacter stercoris]|uniref:DUF3853 family protein n=1 Tax=Empedobacter stercoris TaxID=1628248 RepID=UPI00050A2BC0|nr:DUF3853 family protein [Empedobacter stercoris]UWX66176.1 DUF3853 family protein [Empedobacter stercoris]